jgi:hypothetical protein
MTRTTHTTAASTADAADGDSGTVHDHLGALAATALVALVVAAAGVLVVTAPASAAATAPATTGTGVDAASVDAAPTLDPDDDIYDSGDPSVEIVSVDTDFDEPVAGETVSMSVTVENDGEVPIKIQRVTVRDRNLRNLEYAETRNYRTIEPGERLNAPLSFEFDQAGTHQLETVVTARERDDRADNNATVTDQRPLSVQVREVGDPLLSINGEGLQASQDSRVHIEVSNPTTVPLRNVRLRGGGDVQFQDATRIVPELPAGESRSFEFNVTADSPGRKSITASAEYELANGEAGRVRHRETLRFRDRQFAAVDLSVDELAREDGRLTVEGYVSNVGQDDASSVRISVVGAEGTRPAASGSTQFLGAIPQSEDEGFTVDSLADPNASSLKLRVTFDTNGEQQSRVFTLNDLPRGEQAAAAPAGGSGGSSQTVVVGLGLVVLLILAVIGYAWYNSSGEDPPVGDDEDPLGPGPGAGVQGDGGALQAGGPGGQGQLPPRGGQGQGGPGGQGRLPPRDDQHGQPGGHGAGVRGQSQGGHRAHGRQPQGGHRAHGRQPQAGAGVPGEDRRRCDGCGQPFPRDELGSIGLDDGRTAVACADCQKRALGAAKDRLGARADTGRQEASVDDVLEAMEQPSCDGCGERVPEDDLDRMTLPDGSSAISCSRCRNEALTAARTELTGR